MKKYLLVFAVIALLGGVKLFFIVSEQRERVARGWCAEPLSDREIQVAERNGDSVNPESRCIVDFYISPSAVKTQVVPDPAPVSLAVARKGFQTLISGPANRQELPKPPPDIFVRSDYASGTYPAMPAYVTPDPMDGKRHPAIIWIVGGDFTSFGDFWKPGPTEADESASPFREAGLIMMFPSLRGSANNGSRPEYLLGEVDDVLAAAEHLARLPYVDPERIYLGGHSTGGTLALLVAETSPRFKAVFALGPAAELVSYPWPVHPDMRTHEDTELKLRSPVNWLDGIKSPTYLIEGTEGPSNVRALERLCDKTSNAMVKCVPVPGLNHFSVIAPVAKVIAARIAVEVPGIPFSLKAEDVRK